MQWQCLILKLLVANMRLLLFFLCLLPPKVFGEGLDPRLDPPLTMGHLFLWAKSEIEIYEFVKEYETEDQILQQLISSYMKDYEETSAKVFDLLPKNYDQWQRAKELVKYPLACIRLTYRYVNQLRTTQNYFKQHTTVDFLKDVTDLDGADFPTIDDYKETIESLLNLHHFYNLNSTDLAKGYFQSVQTPIFFEIVHAFETGKHALKLEMYSLAHSWFKTVEILNENSDKGKVDNKLLKEALATVVIKHDEAFDNKTREREYLFEEKLSENSNPKTMREINVEKYLRPIHPASESYLETEEAKYNLISICNGNEYLRQDVKSQLSCRLDSSHPFFIIQPIRVEVFSLDPKVVLFHQAFTPSSLSIIFYTAITQFLDFLAPTYSSVEAFYRKMKKLVPPEEPRDGVAARVVPSVSNVPYLDDDIQPPWLLRHFEMLVGVKVKGWSHRWMSIASKLHGSPFLVHTDYYSKEDTRWAEYHNFGTALIYMTGPELGGETAFPYLGFKVKVGEGSILFWDNNYPDGRPDYRAVHEGCQTLIGIKSFASKLVLTDPTPTERVCSMEKETKDIS